MLFKIQEITRILGSNAQLFIVGGTIRDLLLGQHCGNDLDLATNLTPLEIIRQANINGIQVIPTGIKHGTVILIVKHEKVEITSLRNDGIYKDGRHPESITLGVPLIQDLARRDFTINAIALPAKEIHNLNWSTKIIDPYNGYNDLKNKIIRTVGYPLHRLQEDGLRALRACRFAATFNFKLHPDILNTIPTCLDATKKISIQRLFNELTKMLCTKYPNIALKALIDTKLIDICLPELYPIKYNNQNSKRHVAWKHTLQIINKVPNHPIIRWAALLHDCKKKIIHQPSILNNTTHFNIENAMQTATTILNRLHAKKSFIKIINRIINNNYITPNANWNHTDYRYFLKQLNNNILSINDWSAFKSIDYQTDNNKIMLTQHTTTTNNLKIIANTQPPLTIKSLAISSHLIMELVKIPSGSWLNNVQNFLLNEVLKNPTMNNYQTLKELTISWFKSHYLTK